MSSRRRSAMASTAEPPPTAPAPHLGSRVVRPGSRLAAPVAGTVLALALLAVSVGVLLGRHSGPRASLSAPAARYGGLPSWLPKPTVPVSRVVQASRAHPALAIEGDAVSVDLGRGRVLATAVGPSVPKTGQFPVRATSPCTFIVTFAAASGVIPLSTTAFTLIDQLGHVRHPRVTAMGGGAPPTHVSPGRGVSLSLYDVLPTGNGSLTWAPGGGRPIVAWDFAVEID